MIPAFQGVHLKMVSKLLSKWVLFNKFNGRSTHVIRAYTCIKIKIKSKGSRKASQRE